MDKKQHARQIRVKAMIAEMDSLCRIRTLVDGAGILDWEFPRPKGYQDGNMTAAFGRSSPPAAWTYNMIDPMSVPLKGEGRLRPLKAIPELSAAGVLFHFFLAGEPGGTRAVRKSDLRL